MAAPTGNFYWKMRTKSGRDKLFKSPAALLNACLQYFKWCESNPIGQQDWKGKDATPVTIEHPRPFIWSGLCIYLGCNRTYFNDFKDRLKAKGELSEVSEDKDFSDVIAYIEDIMHNQKFSLAAAGLLKENIISRELGLADKQQVEANVKFDGYEIGFKKPDAEE